MTSIEQQEENKQVSQTMLKQIGKKRLFFMGAQHFLYEKNYLQFKVKGNRKFNSIVIRLNELDYYDIELWQCKTLTKDPYIINDKIKEFNNIDCEHLGELLFSEVLYK